MMVKQSAPKPAANSAKNVRYHVRLSRFEYMYITVILANHYSCCCSVSIFCNSNCTVFTCSDFEGQKKWFLN